MGRESPQTPSAAFSIPSTEWITTAIAASGGAGLGLAIARRAVELHKGKIRATIANPGLLVEIEFPRVEAAGLH